MTKKNNCHPERPHSCKGLCQQCYMKEYRSANKAKEAHAQWRKDNLEHYLIKQKEWALKNPEKVKETKKRYVSKNLDQYRAQCAKRHAAKLMRTPKWADLSRIKQFYMNCPEGMEVDHIVPLQGDNVSGLHMIENLQYLSKAENCAEGNKFSAGEL